MCKKPQKDVNVLIASVTRTCRMIDAATGLMIIAACGTAVLVVLTLLRGM
jgi:hypothetical protein